MAQISCERMKNVGQPAMYVKFLVTTRKSGAQDKFLLLLQTAPVAIPSTLFLVVKAKDHDDVAIAFPSIHKESPLSDNTIFDQHF